MVERLAELISFDTRNPEGDERPLVQRLGGELRALGAASVEEVDVGDHAYVYARFGAEPPRLLLNAHVDTVPANERLHVAAAPARAPRATGCTASAPPTSRARSRPSWRRSRPGPITRPVGVLFSGDEEHGGSCIRAFLESEAARGLERAIVCEPTSCRVGVRHRGIGAATVTLEATGRPLVARRRHGEPDRGAGARRGRARRHGASSTAPRDRPGSRA